MKWSGNDEVVVGVQRITWPMISNKNEYINNPENNPFCDSFYEYKQPTLATYRKCDGKLSYRFGVLPSFAKKTKTGYCFSDMVFDYWNDEVVYGSAYDGRIMISSRESLDCQDCQRLYIAFQLDDSIFQVPDSSDYYSYNCNALAEPYLSRKIVDLKIDDEYIHCLVRNCTDAFERPELEDYNYIVIDRNTGKRDVMKFPSRDSNERRVAYGLKRNLNGTVRPFYLRSFNDGWRIVEVSADRNKKNNGHNIISNLKN